MTNLPTVAYLGYGAFAKQIEQMLCEMKNPLADAPVVFFDDFAYHDGVKNSFPFELYQEARFNDCFFIVSIGYCHLKKKYQVVQNLRKLSRKLLSVIHPSAVVSPSARIEAGCVIFPGCIVDMNSVIGSGTVLYDGCVIAHDSAVDACSFCAPRVTIAGRTKIGSRTFLGIGSTVINDICCGCDCIIGAASLIQKSLPDGTTGVGNPFHIVSDKKIGIH